MKFHSYLVTVSAPAAAPVAHRCPRPGRRRHHAGDAAATLYRLPRRRRTSPRYPGITSLLRP